MVESDRGGQWAHGLLFYSVLSLSNVSDAKKKQNKAAGVIWSWDVIHREDSSTHVIIDTSCKML